MLTQQTTNTWRNLAHPSDASPSRCRRSVFVSKQQRAKSSAGLAMKYKCSSASLCSQKRHTRWHVSWPLRSEALQWITGPQRIPRADVPSCGQKRHTRWPATNASACNELRMRYSTRTYPWVLPDNRRISMRTCSSMDFETTIRLHKLSGFGKPPILCVNPGYLSKPYKNFGFGYVGYLVCLSVYLSVYVSTHLFLYLSWCLTICLCVHVSICLSRHLCL